MMDWTDKIDELERHFASIELPAHPIKPNAWSTINSCADYIDSHLQTCRANNGKERFLPYLTRLEDLRILLSTSIA